MTTITSLPTPWALLNSALQARQPLWVSYHRRRRLICPHALGWKARRPMVLGYQTGGETTTGALQADPRKRWRCMYIDEIDRLVAADPASPWATADNYNHSHPFPAIDTVAIAITPWHP
ncbi:MAG: hypothetical protein M3063_15215 [Actinomycetota bacterium]|nr:hypothetical protein [Actinomycetota bacterium]